MTGTFTVEQLRPIKDGMTISRDAKMGQTTAVTFFSLGKDTSISQERYDVTSIYIGAKGTADFLIGDLAKKEPVSDGDCLIVPGDTLCGVETTTGTVYTEIIIKKETTMNSIVKSGEVMKLKDLISYEEGSIANLDVVSNGTMKFVLMAFDEGTGLHHIVHPATQLSSHSKERLPSVMRARITRCPQVRISVLIRMVCTALPLRASLRWLCCSYWNNCFYRLRY